MSDKDQGATAGRTQELFMLGEIKGLVQGLKDGQIQQERRLEGMEHRVDQRFDKQDERYDASEARANQRFDNIDGRLRTVETKAAIAGALSGSAMAVGTALVIEGIKQWISNRSIGQ